MSINRVVISGNLTRDPEMRQSQSGMGILTFGMAVNDRRRNQQTGEWEDYANFVDCVLFGNRADYLSRTLRKGTKVVVEGKLRYSSWERDGQRRSKLEVVVDDLDFVSPRQQQGGYVPQQGGYNNTPQNQGYGTQPAYSAPAQMPPAPATPNYAAPQPAAPAPQAQAPQAPAPAPTRQPASSGAPVTAQPETDVYDSDIPF